ncbi:hypothetical protein FF011L_03470 [Roseimaritima multifibrata]|uniref:Uncharacterized protein n=1 Tax=Roseimaritima multifibrata TaxID=1930274 RepID=A0A517MA01_9BACT|nr:hypothetical protein [Roseimaritima multifibrata]QDS91617.1 hypothetical protein FF011L_03470 [Roseimaritima multifibrata]
MTTSFFSELANLKAILGGSTSTEEKWKEVKPLLADEPIKREFWSLLDSADWISVLESAAEFESPPTPDISEDASRFPRWDASKYLVRMASLAPADVARILASVRTANTSVNGDIIDAANKLPIDDAVCLVPAIRYAAENLSVWVHFKDACEFCVKLCDSGHMEEAFELAEALFLPREPASERSMHDPKDYWYREGLQQVSESLVSASPERMIICLRDWVGILGRVNRGEDSTSIADDYSYIWRPAIEEHEQNSDYDLAGFVVGVLREVCERAIGEDLIPVSRVLAILTEQELDVFRRFRVHLINVFADRVPELARAVLLDRASFDDFALKHEYARLVQDRFGELPESDRKSWIEFVDQGRPDVDREYPFFESDEHLTNYARYWRFHRLHLIRRHLSDQLLDEYNKLLEEFEDGKLAEFHSYSGPLRYGYESPIELDALRQLDFADALKAVCEWDGESTSSFGPSVQGLADRFEQYVKDNASSYSRFANELIDKPAPFVSAFLSAMRNAVTEGKAISIEPTLELCVWLIDGKRSAGGDSYVYEQERALDLIRGLLDAQTERKEPSQSLLDGRLAIWGCIETMCEATPNSWVLQDNEPDDPRDHDFTTLAINSARGKAVETAFAYAGWIRSLASEVTNQSFEALDLIEFRQVLESQACGKNRSWVGLAIIGSHLSTIYHFDERWLENHRDLIFRLEDVEEDPEEAFGWAAWNAFLTWTQPHRVYLDLFRSQYEYACSQTSEVAKTERRSQSPMRSLSQHIAIYYGRGYLSLEVNGSLIRILLTNARPCVRRQLLQFIGNSLRGEKELPQEVVNRFQSLWDFYWPMHGCNDFLTNPEEFVFADWFAFGSFDEVWALQKLKEAVFSVPAVIAGRDVVNRLAQQAERDPLSSIQLLQRFIESDDQNWRVAEWSAAATDILRTSLNSESSKARDIAESLIDRLGRSGFLEFGKLLGDKF